MELIFKPKIRRSDRHNKQHSQQ